MDLVKSAWTLASMLGAQEGARSLNRMDTDQVLGAFGLERRARAESRALPGLGLFLTGAAIGAGAALCLARSSGSELRARIKAKVYGVKERLGDKVATLQHRGSPADNGAIVHD